jgi:hypothetical protein
LFGSRIHFIAADGTTIGYPKFARGVFQTVGALECDEAESPSRLMRAISSAAWSLLTTPGSSRMNDAPTRGWCLT